MSKSTCQKKLKRMTEERDSWRDIAKEREKEINDLKDQLERNGMYLRAFTGGIANLDQDIAKLQSERNQAQKELARTRELIGESYVKTLTLLDETQEYAKERHEAIENTAEATGFLPYVGQILYKSLEASQRMYSDIDETRIKPSIEKHVGESIFDHPDLTLNQIMHYSRMTGLYQYSNFVLLHVWIEADDPRLLAGYAIYTTRETGEPDLMALNQIPTDWLEEHIGIKKASTLATALETVHQCKTSGMEKTNFVRDYGIDRKTYYQYERWVNQLEEQANTLDMSELFDGES